MTRRKVITSGITLYEFMDEFLVVCPECSRKAVVRAGTPSNPPRLVCPCCGHSRDWKQTAHGIRFSQRASGWPDGMIAVGDAADAYFHLPLWLQLPCAGHALWAFNERHLAFLQEFVSATDRSVPNREPGGPLNALLVSRLPKWIKLGRNRGAVLRTLEKLQARALEAG